jgi:hypothetical protein
MKYCKDCKNFLDNMDFISDYRVPAKCVISVIVDPVFGCLVHRHCATCRASDLVEMCGPDARFFKPKETEKAGAK